jgi:hypothetical protein
MGQASLSAFNRDRRAAERMPTTLRGKLFPGPIDCTIADFTRQGARLRFAEPPEVGETVIVVVWSSGLAFEAVTRWRTGLEVGVEFIASRDLRRPAPAALAEVQALWLKRRPRIARRALIAQAGIIEKRSRWPRRSGWRTQRPTLLP